MNRLLVIVDPQVDFITGSLPVPGAAEAMDALAVWLRGEGARAYRAIVVTADRHPFRHSSFIMHGGQWPPHCIHDSAGAAIWPPLMEALCAFPGQVIILHKGERPDTDEYSVFQSPGCADRICSLAESIEADGIDICGLAGDICVRATALDAARIFGHGAVRVLRPFSPSLDGGAALDRLEKTLSAQTGDLTQEG